MLQRGMSEALVCAATAVVVVVVAEGMTRLISCARAVTNSIVMKDSNYNSINNNSNNKAVIIYLPECNNTAGIGPVLCVCYICMLFYKFSRDTHTGKTNETNLRFMQCKNILMRKARNSVSTVSVSEALACTPCVRPRLTSQPLTSGRFGVKRILKTFRNRTSCTQPSDIFVVFAAVAYFPHTSLALYMLGLVISLYFMGEEKIGEERTFFQAESFYVHFVDG